MADPYAGLHSAQTFNHRIESWVFATTAARAAGTGYTISSNDIGKVAYQTDSETYWRLTGVSPLTWIPFAGSGVFAPPDATYIVTESSVDLSAERILGTQIVMRGVVGARPAANANGANGGELYYATDEKKVYRSNGTTWDLWDLSGSVIAINYTVLTGVPSSVIVFVMETTDGSAIPAGTQQDFWCPAAATIQGVTMLANASGSAVVDIWVDTYANYPPTDADSITAAAPPTIAAATKAQDLTLTGWDTVIAAGDCIRVNVDSCTGISRLTLVLKVQK